MQLTIEATLNLLGEQEPARLWFGARAVRVAEILDRWWAPDHRYYKLRGEDGARYIVRYDLPAARWDLTLYEREEHDTPRGRVA